MKRTLLHASFGLLTFAVGLAAVPNGTAHSSHAPGAPGIQEEDHSPKVQIIFVKYEDEKELKSLSKKLPLYRFGEEVAVMGEMVLPPNQHKLGTPLQVYVPVLPKSPKIKKPLAVAPYEFKKDGSVKVISKHKKSVVSIPAANQVVISVGNGQGLKTSTLSDFGLYSVCQDLDQRRMGVLTLLEELGDIKRKDDPETWEVKRRQLLQKWESLLLYVEGSSLFRNMGPKLRKEFEKETAKLIDKSSQGRMEEAMKSVADATPEKLDLGSDIDLEFHQLESQHVRMVYLVGEGGITDDYARQLVGLTEETIELFQRIAIDPFEEFRKEQDGDVPIIPSGIFQEYFVGPESKETREQLWTEHYGLPVKDNRIFDGMATGTILRWERSEPLYMGFAKNQSGSLPGWVVHRTGHTLASLHYNRSNEKTVGHAIPLIQESVATHLSFEKLGSNTVTCSNFKEATYDKPELGKDDKKVEVWDTYRDRFYKLSMRAPKFDDCAIVPLNKLNELHMAKGWMMYQYILAHDGVQGQKWLRQAHTHFNPSKGDGDRVGLDRNGWREQSQELFGEENVEGDPLAVYEDRLREEAIEQTKSK